MKKETIEDVDLELPKAKLPRVEKEYFNLSDVAKCISTKGGLVDTGNTQELIPYKNAVITVDLQTDEDVTLSNKNITLYDLSVMDAVYTLLKSGRESFTPEMVCRVMSGNLEMDVKPQKAGAVTKSLNKLSLIRISIDCTKEFEERGFKLRKGEKGTLEGYLLPLRVARSLEDMTGISTYVSLNVFNGRKREAAHMRFLTSMYVDVDIHDAEDQELQRKKTVTQRLLLGKIRAGVLPTPTMITDTGCGYGLYYVLSNTIANTKAAEKIKGYYTAVYNALIKRFQQELPGLVDPSVKDAARICRLPGTTNPVSGTVCRLVYCDLERKWNLKDLSGYVNLEEYKRKKSLLSVKDVSRLPKRGESAFACSGSNLSESSRASGEKVVLACVNICSFSLSVFSCR